MNEPAEIACIFSELIEQHFQHSFAQIVFAVLDHSPDARIINPLKNILSGN